VNDKQVALAACDSVQTDRVTKAAGVFMDAFFMAEGSPNADALRKECGERFKTSLRVYKEAHDSSRTLLGEAFPGA
jgi:hypothetical protein